MKYKNYILIVLIFFASCKTEDKILKKHLIEINKRGIAQIDITGWKEKFSYIENSYVEYTIYKSIGDSTINFDFRCNDNKYTIIRYSIEYIDIESNYIYVTELREDTLFIYRFLRPTPFPLEFEDLEFIVGKYEYMYKNMKLSKGQRAYYEQNRDSLQKIRGNNLAELPSLDIY